MREWLTGESRQKTLWISVSHCTFQTEGDILFHFSKDLTRNMEIKSIWLNQKLIQKVKTRRFCFQICCYRPIETSIIWWYLFHSQSILGIKWCIDISYYVGFTLTITIFWQFHFKKSWYRVALPSVPNRWHNGSGVKIDPPPKKKKKKRTYADIRRFVQIINLFTNWQTWSFCPCDDTFLIFLVFKSARWR